MGDKLKVQNYWKIDEQSDVLISLREVLHQLGQVADNINCWKWAVIAMASALNGALTCNLTGTMQIGALKEETAKKTILALQHGSTVALPRPWLASPLDLLKRAAGTKRLERAGPPLVLENHQVTRFKKLFYFRDEFLHFKPVSWSIEVSGMPIIFKGMIQIIHQIIEDGWSFRHMDDSLVNELRETCLEIIKILTDLEQILEG